MKKVINFLKTMKQRSKMDEERMGIGFSLLQGMFFNPLKITRASLMPYVPVYESF